MKCLFENGIARLDYYPEYFDNTRWFGLLRDGISWQQNEITIFGKTHPEPRKTAWFGPAYSYSSIHWPAQELSPIITELKQKIEELLGSQYNAVLLNYYRDGQDSMGWHRDNEKNIDPSSIASVSFGKARPFKLRSRDKTMQIEQMLGMGDVLEMRHLQSEHEHALPKSKTHSGERINLTFRKINSPR